MEIHSVDTIQCQTFSLILMVVLLACYNDKERLSEYVSNPQFSHLWQQISIQA